MTSERAEGAIAIQARGIAKAYGATLALKGVDLTIRAGTIHALMGENGAGKSTFLGVVAGRVTPSDGIVTIFGEAYETGSPRRAHAQGIATIYQELTIVPAMSAVANVYLGQTPARGGIVANRTMLDGFADLCRQLAIRIDPKVRAGSLSVANQQMLEIMRGIQSRARILLFDEPTAALAPPERQALFALMRRLRDEGHTMMLVSHNLDEVLDIADTVTVFREGQVVSTAPRGDWTKPSLVRAMIGHDVAEARPRKASTVPRTRCDPALNVRGLRLDGALQDISFALFPGEILGIGGLVGSGRSTLLRCLAGLEPTAHGDLQVSGCSVAWPRSPRQALRLGIALVPEDRKAQGLVLNQDAVRNVTMTNLAMVSRWGFLDGGAMVARTAEAVRTMGFDPARMRLPVRHLSGGNQQKVLLAKRIFDPPRVLMVDEPTRGIDIGAKEEIMARLREMADRGMAVIVVSSELEEVVAMSDRVLVLSHGQMAARLDAARDEVSVQSILNAAFRINGDDFHGDRHDFAHHA
jgi:ABC-type sugar transport system ATPase subunit